MEMNLIMDLIQHNARLLNSIQTRKMQSKMSSEMCSLQNFPESLGSALLIGSPIQVVRCCSKLWPLPTHGHLQMKKRDGNLLGWLLTQMSETDLSLKTAQLSSHPFGQNWATCSLLNQTLEKDQTSQSDFGAEWGQLPMKNKAELVS